jgi:hypothetical protein
VIKDRESPLMQEMGPKKYNRMVEKSDKFYDKYKAGRRDPKTGDFYYHIGVKPPRTSDIKSNYEGLGVIACPKCGKSIEVSNNSNGKVCFCGELIFFTTELKESLRVKNE